MSDFGTIKIKTADGRVYNNRADYMKGYNNSTKTSSDNIEIGSKLNSGSSSGSSSTGASCWDAMVAASAAAKPVKKDEDGESIPRIIPASSSDSAGTQSSTSSDGKSLGASCWDAMVAASAAAKPVKKDEDGESIPRIIPASSSDSAGTGTTTGQDLLRMANSNNLNRDNILRDIAAGVQNGETLDKIKSDISDNYNLKTDSDSGTYSPSIDYSIDGFQGSYSTSDVDANLMAASMTKNGENGLGSEISQDMNGNTKVTLDGKTFTYTPDQIKQAQSSINGISGDDDATAMKLAYGDYLNTNTIDGKALSDDGGQSKLQDDNGTQLGSMITGQTVNSITNDYQEPQGIFGKIKSLFGFQNTESTNYKINSGLDKISDNNDENKDEDTGNSSAVATFKSDTPWSEPVNSGSTYVVKKVDGNNVVLTDPTSTAGNEITMSRDSFLKNTDDFTLYS